MATHNVRRLTIGVSALALAAPLAVAAAGAAGATPARPAPRPPGHVVVVAGLNNPRQLSLVDNAELLIAEAGKGGTIPAGADPESGDATFAGATASVSAVLAPQLARNQSPRRVITGLISVAGQDGSAATGADGVSALNRRSPIYVQLTDIPAGVLPASLERSQNGKLIQARPYGRTSVVADISGFEARHDPDRHGVESNPYAVLAQPNRLLVADAAANDVLSIDRRGRVTVLHVFGNITDGACAAQQDPPGFAGCNFVPTSLATDRWGNIYVGALGSLVPNEGRVVKLDPSGRRVLRTWTGLTAVTGLAVAGNGDLYVSQLFAPEAAPINPAVQGVLTKISANGRRTNVDVPFPTGVELDRWGNVYVSAFSIAPSTGLADPTSGAVVPGTSGQVWRLRF